MVARERVIQVLDYNADTGVFVWKVNRSKARAGCVAGHVCPIHGYRLIGVDGRVYGAHRLAWLIVHGRFPSKLIDHINGDKLDNRIANLRDVSHSENLQNQEHPRYANPHLGVSWQKSRQKWRADICIGRQQRTLGRFDTQEEARAAYLDAKRQLHIPGRLIWPDLPAPAEKVEV